MENCSDAAVGIRPAVEMGADAAGGGRSRRAVILAAVLIPLAGAIVLGFWRWQGAVGLAGSAAGVAVGGAISLVGQLLRRRAWTVTGPKLVQTMMLSLCASFSLFIGAALLAVLLAREAAPAVLLTAFGIFLAVSLVDALCPPGGEVPEGKGSA
jgi:hypothetical protein